MAELDRNAHVVRDQRQRFVQSRDVDLQRGWKLDEDRPELVPQSAGPAEEPLHRLFRILQLLDVREVAAHLGRHDEVVRGALTPLGERLLFR
jgi:hypothetical protein